MDTVEKKARAKAKREELRNGRNRAASEASSDAQGIGGYDANAFGAAFQDARGTASTFTATGDPIKLRHRRDRNDEPSTTGQPERIGRSDRRIEEGNSSAAPHSPADEKPARREHQPAVSIGNLATEELITEPAPLKLEPDATFDTPLPELSPYKEDYQRSTRDGQHVYALIADTRQYITSDAYKQLVSKKGQPGGAAEEKPKMFRPGQVLSAAEAEELYEPLCAALSDDFGYIDQLLWKINPNLDERPIWGNTTTKEDQAIAKMLIKRGQKSAAAAATVRGLVDSTDYIMVGMAVLPRINETVAAIRERPRTQRKKSFSLVRTPDNAS